jgi:hypothetical protein
VDIRPRTTGEIVDDAWRLYLADASTLLALSSLFNVPAAVVFLWLITQATTASWVQGVLIAALFATLLPATGLGSAACQQAFHFRAENRAVSVKNCLFAALPRGLQHIAAAAVSWSAPLIAAVLVLWPLALLMRAASDDIETADVTSSLTWMRFLCGLIVLAPILPAAPLAGWAAHPILASTDSDWYSAIWAGWRESQRQLGKTVAIVASRPALGLFTFVNLHIVVRVVLWIGDDLAGFDWSVPSHVLSLGNPIYDITMILLTGILLAPFHEATNYLMHVDARTRYEGLDLWYRVQRAFHAGSKGLAGAVLLAIGAVFFAATPVRAEDNRRQVIDEVHEEVGRIAKEVKDADPFSSTKPWQPRMSELAMKLNERGGKRPGSFRWFEQSLTGFARADRDIALKILRDLESRLALAEESLAAEPRPAEPLRSKDEIKALLPSDNSAEPGRRPDKAAEDKKKAKQRVRREEMVVDDGPAGSGGEGAGVVPRMPDLGLGTTGWLILVGLLVAVVLIAVLLTWRSSTTRTAGAATKTVQSELSLETLLAQTDRPIGENLWRQADELARGGRWLDGLRTLYMAVLALLHRADLIRYSQTRTNGEYLAQVRQRTEVYLPFESMTGLFELKWYGEKTCQPDDYQSCRQLAEQVRAGIK